MCSKTVLTIAICTYNHKELAVRALRSALEQVPPGISVEILVVDNNSNDGTKRACEDVLSGGAASARVVVEENVGLSHARNRAYLDASGEYVAYIDDDAYLGDEWVDRALSIIDKLRPDVFGGSILPFYDDDKPKWVTDDIATRRLAVEAREMVFGETLSGSNMVFRGALLRTSGGFLPDYGMSGAKVNVGEETELQMRLWASDAASRWYFDPALAVYHLFATSKTHPRYRLRRSYAEGKAYAMLSLSLSGESRLVFAAKATAKAMARVAIAIAKLPFCGSWQRWVFCDLAPVPRSFGMLVGGLRRS
jgi:glycosyltransferase involved in cell wall biosynthesis